MPREGPASEAGHRLAALDVARGIALLWMATYHLAWDLTYFGLIQPDILGDPVWWVQPLVITTSFLFIVGVSLSLATHRRRLPRHYLRRTGLVGGAAAAITAGTLLFFGDGFIFFGVLHCITLSSLIGLAFARAPAWLLVASAVAALGVTWVTMPAIFDDPLLIWLGLGERVPFTNDFVPLFPWLAPMLAGMAFGRIIASRADRASPLAQWQPTGFATMVPAWLGRHSLAFYLGHQLVLLGLLFGLHAATGLGNPSYDHFFPERQARAAFLQSCEASCASGGWPAEGCAARCICVAGQLGDFDAWASADHGSMRAHDQTLLATLGSACEEAGR